MKVEDTKPQTVNQFVLKSWPRDALCPDNKAAIIALINVVEKSQYKTGNGPLIIHCHTGVEASGLMAAISCVWDKMKVDQEVDIFHTVKQLRYHLPNAVQHLVSVLCPSYSLIFKLYSSLDPPLGWDAK